MNLYNIDPDLNWYVDYEELLNEFFWYLDHKKGELSLICLKNKIIKYFQQDVYFAVEKELWRSSDDVKQRIIDNRIKYLGKKPEELTTYDILSGFKKSAMHYGYSGFNPQLCKWFYEYVTNTTNLKMDNILCYDPTGGWGHRLLGSTNIGAYIYNDLSTDIYNNVNNMIEVFDMPDMITYNNDAADFIPNEKFNVMFTCPPYYNLEHYPCGDFKSMDEYNTLIESLFNVFLNTDCKVFGMVIREDLLVNKHPELNPTIFPLTKLRSAHLNGSTPTKNKELLFIYRK